MDDPYRSLAGAVLSAGGCAKNATPFSEFLGADFFRRQIDAAQIKDDAAIAVRKELKLAHGSGAGHLPGYRGSG
jgi:hypothetical protein